jgi:hypothetical protein
MGRCGPYQKNNFHNSPMGIKKNLMGHRQSNKKIE